MAGDALSGLRDKGLVLLRPWPLVLAGLAMAGGGLALASSSWIVARVLLALAGVLTAGVAISRRLQSAGQELPERVESAGLTAVAGLAPLLAALSCDASWDSIRLLFAVLAGVALAASVLVLLPRVARRVVASLLVVFHFGGILTACTSVPLRDQPAPWVSIQLWTHVYRPYLTFMYLTNAYHFYSPDPGPPSLLWFRVSYQDGTMRWIRLPVREEVPLSLPYQRYLALAESTNNPMPRPPLTRAERTEVERRTGQAPQQDPWEDILRRREQGGRKYSPPIPLAVDLLATAQYMEPNFITKMYISSYARHVGLEETRPVKDIRIYRLTHMIPTPAQVAHGVSLLDETLYRPVYLGRYDREGNLIDTKDPMLYWYMPILAVPPDYGRPGTDLPLLANRPPQLGDKFFNALNIHAQDGDGVYFPSQP
jgi:hypothetical protein